MSDDLRVVGEGTLAAAQRWKARAETAEADADRERELGKSHFTRAISAEAALEDVEAERDKLREALDEAIGRLATSKIPEDHEAALRLHAALATPAPVDEEER